jgi:hypothetical protein
MSFESLSFRNRITIDNFPERWLPLIHLYDPDLPLFPIYYFHVLKPNIVAPERPADNERAYGYVEKTNLVESDLEVTVVSNKDLSDTSNRQFITPVENEIRERFGLINPVTLSDVTTVFQNQLAAANPVLSEMWHRVVTNAYGNRLPFGRLWDEVLGLTRFVASWFSGGRKGELIQTHYFISKFGERIQTAGNIPAVDFYLLPTINELTDLHNPLNSFPNYSKLKDIARRFQTDYCDIINVAGINLSKFRNPRGGRFNTEGILEIITGSSIPRNLRYHAFECFNSFDKGPQRTVLFLMMLDDIASGRLSPAALTSSQCGSIYDGLARTYQAPKVIEIYSQQSYGNPSAMPIDTWISSFFKYPLCIYPTTRMNNLHEHIFSNANNLGKVERLLWVTAQSRKVHSSACNDAFWCVKYGSSKKDRKNLDIKEEIRGANPLSCNICLASIRSVCPAYEKIKNNSVSFNDDTSGDFHIITSDRNNSTSSQTFLSCRGNSIYGEILDLFSPADYSEGFASYPAQGHSGNKISVEQFVNLY